jgi:competence protein ComEA
MPWRGATALPVVVTVSLVLFGLCGLVVARPVAVAAQEATSQDPLPKGAGRETVASTCGVCHDIDTAIGKRRTAADWQDIINAMINRGAMGSQDDFRAVLGYMSKFFGLVNVNTASAKDLAEVLDISAIQAEAVVQFRTQNGEIKTLDVLASVPGIDAETIEKRKDRVVFK